jgi:hypothetical protein
MSVKMLRTRDESIYFQKMTRAMFQMFWHGRTANDGAETTEAYGNASGNDTCFY